jgi:hypothetical protein
MGVDQGMSNTEDFFLVEAGGFFFEPAALDTSIAVVTGPALDAEVNTVVAGLALVD